MSTSHRNSFPLTGRGRPASRHGRIATSLLTGAVLSLAVAAPASAQTPCAQWDVFGGWTAIQGNYRVDFQLNQQGTNVYGTGSFYKKVGFDPFDPFRSFSAYREYQVTGTVRGNAIELRTGWGGVYVGRIDFTGRIDGFTYDQRDSTSAANWFSNRRMTCAEEASSAPPAPPPRAPQPVPSGSDLLTPARGSVASSVFRTGSAPIPAPIPTPASGERPSIYCKPGFVWRVARPSDLVCVTPKSRDRVAGENAMAAKRVQPGGGAYGPNTCRAGYVWREAFPGDLVCVTPGRRSAVWQENQLASSRVQ